MDKTPSILDTTLSKRTSASLFDYGSWRNNFLRNTLIGASIFGLVALAPTFFSAAPIYIAIDAAAYAILLLVTFARLPYRLRAGTLLALIYVLGLSGLFETGIWGDARLFFLAFVVMTCLLFSARAGITAIAISLASTIVLGWLILSGQYRPTSPNVTAGALSDWLTAGTALLLTQAVATAGLYLFQREFDTAQERSEETFSVLQLERRNLESRVKERTEELENKTNQLRASSYIARQIIELQDMRTLLSRVVQLISEQFGYYHASIFLLDEQRRVAFLQAASSGEGQKMMERGYHVAIEDMNIIGRVAERRKLFMLTDSGPAASLTKYPELPLTRSELALPLMVRGKVLGVLDIHSDKSQAFGPNEADVLQALADQLATSIDNVRLLNETQTFVSQLESLTAQQTQVSWQEYLRRRNLGYQYTPAGIRQFTPGASGKSKSAMHIPLQLRGQEIGTITVQRKEASDWQEAERELIEKIATQVALALDNSRLLEDSRRRAVQEQTVSEIAAHLSRSLDIDSLLQTAVRELSTLPEIAEVSVYIGEQNDKGRKVEVK